MATMLQTTFLDAFIMNEKIAFDKMSLKFVHKGLIGNQWALVQVMACRRIGDKSLFEPMLTGFIDAYMQHSGEIT